MNKKKKKLTRQRLMTLLNYNEHTGFFTNKISRGRVSSGELAGTIDGGGYVRWWRPAPKLKRLDYWLCV
jgi:hypothetical protein